METRARHKVVGIYVRVSTSAQDTISQERDLRAWLAGQADLGPVKWYSDKATGTNMDRPGWQALEADLRAGKVSLVACWHVDRLARSVVGMARFFDELKARNVGLVCLQNGVDTRRRDDPSTRLLLDIVSAFSAYETRNRGERVRAGQEAARARGKRWGGSVKGRRLKVTPEQVKAIVAMKTAGDKVSAIARTVSLSRLTVYRLLAEQGNALRKG